MNEEEEMAVRDNYGRILKQRIDSMKRRNESKGENRIDLTKIKPEQREFLENTQERVKEWFENTTDKELDLDQCNPFERKLLLQELGDIYEGKLAMKTIYGYNRTSYIHLERVSGETAEDRLIRETNETIDGEIGFSRVLKELKNHKHLFLVGHNALLDLMHTTHKFIKPLPKSSEDFKVILRDTFET